MVVSRGGFVGDPIRRLGSAGCPGDPEVVAPARVENALAMDRSRGIGAEFISGGLHPAVGMPDVPQAAPSRPGRVRGIVGTHGAEVSRRAIASFGRQASFRNLCPGARRIMDVCMIRSGHDDAQQRLGDCPRPARILPPAGIGRVHRRVVVIDGPRRCRRAALGAVEPGPDFSGKAAHAVIFISDPRTVGIDIRPQPAVASGIGRVVIITPRWW